MSLLSEYINKKLSVPEMEDELLQLINKYNKLRSTFLLVYAAATEKSLPIPNISLSQADYFTIYDLLKKDKNRNVDIYIETHGGSGESAEEIARFLHNKYKKVSFVVSGEAKSAGTIIVLSGNDILMTETGSLGPIDAQIKIGRSVVSAYDYIDWVEEKQKEAKALRILNPFDATMVAQITPGELKGVWHALDFAKKLVIEWLPKYKFKNWKVTQTRRINVTDQVKAQRAKEIANKLTDHSRWKSHGRSIKIKDLTDEIGLKIICIDKQPELSDIVYRIQTIIRLIFDNTSVFKIFATQDQKIFRSATLVEKPIKIPQKAAPSMVRVEQKCPKCGKLHKLYGKLIDDSNIDKKCKSDGLTPFPKDAKIKCDCGFEIDILGIKNQIEIQTGQRIITEK